MNRIFDYLNNHMAAVLSISLALMLTTSIFAMLGGFKHIS